MTNLKFKTLRQSFLVLAIALFAFVAMPLTQAQAAGTTAQTTPVIKLDAQEQALFDKINAARKAANLAPVTINTGLLDLTHFRASDMVKRNYFSHVTPEGTGLMDWLVQRGFDFQDAGEIIHRNDYAANKTAEQAFQGYMNSKAHREIMLDPYFTQVGVGHAVNSKGVHYYAVIFILPY